MFAESKDEVSLILFGTAGTANHLATDDEYQHITEARPMGPVNLDLIQYVKNEITPGPAVADCILNLNDGQMSPIISNKHLPFQNY